VLRVPGIRKVKVVLFFAAGAFAVAPNLHRFSAARGERRGGGRVSIVMIRQEFI
jgi:hypothetical protein